MWVTHTTFLLRLFVICTIFLRASFTCTLTSTWAVTSIRRRRGRSLRHLFAYFFIFIKVWCATSTPLCCSSESLVFNLVCAHFTFSVGLTGTTGATWVVRITFIATITLRWRETFFLCKLASHFGFTFIKFSILLFFTTAIFLFIYIPSCLRRLTMSKNQERLKT